MDYFLSVGKWKEVQYPFGNPVSPPLLCRKKGSTVKVRLRVRFTRPNLRCVLRDMGSYRFQKRSA